MALTAQEVFNQTVKALPPGERLRLAALILDELAHSDAAVVDRSDTWSEQDQSDLTAVALKYASALYHTRIRRRAFRIDGRFAATCRT